MSNSNQPAYPLVEETRTVATGHDNTTTAERFSPGLTKLERFTLAAMQGICASGPTIDNYLIGAEAVTVATATLEALERRRDSSEQLALAVSSVLRLVELGEGEKHPDVRALRKAYDQYRGHVV